MDHWPRVDTYLQIQSVRQSDCQKTSFPTRTIEPNSTTAKAISRASRRRTLPYSDGNLANGLVVEKQVCGSSAPIQPQDQTVPVISYIIESDNKQNWEVKQTKRFQISNQSKQPITNVTIKATLPQALQPQLASEGHRIEGYRSFWISLRYWQGNQNARRSDSGRRFR